MSYKWQGTSESGILRKKDQRDKLDDLLVFGYACKLFRDDEKALYIDQGKHLIPWMGDDKLKIDRYDGRGTLSEIASCEASREGYDAMRWLGLNETERRLEQLCDEERYRSLNTNEEEEELYKEEELKRVRHKAKEVEYSYVDDDDDATATARPENDNSRGPSLPSEGEEEEETYVAPPELDVPVNVTLPSTVKVNARIEKTALFISKQGPQMEILLKAKQKNNPQFGFMNQEDPLYRYYRHVLNSIKTGHYHVKTTEQTTTVAERQDEEDEKNDTDEHYLHPSLITAPVLVESAPPLPALPFKPSADCAYSQLVTRIQSQSQPDTIDTQQQQQQQAYQQQLQHNTQMTSVQQQHYYQQTQQFYAQYYEYYRQQKPQYDVRTVYQRQAVSQADGNHDRPSSVDATTTPNNPYAQIVSNVSAAAAATSTTTTIKADVPNPYAQIISKVQEVDAATNKNNHLLPLAAIEPIAEITKAPILYNRTASKPVRPPLPTQNDIKKPLLSLAQYGSESEDEDDDDDDAANVNVEESHSFITPPADTQIIIDKMASYVAKNGTDFEAIVKSKGDPRFVFLDPTHEHYGYYKYKIGLYANFSKKVDAQSDVDKAESEEAKRNRDKKIIAPVSFSIKKAKEMEQTIEKSALPVEESDEEKEPSASPTDTEGTATIEQSKDVDVLVADVETNSCCGKDETAATVAVDVVDHDDDDDDDKAEKEVRLSPNEDPLLELIDLTDDLEERRDAKRAEDRLKDKIAAAAREKLSSSTRDKALQLERKKRAAAFLSQLKTNSGEMTTKTGGGGTPSSNETDANRRTKTEQDVARGEHDAADSEEDGEIRSGGRHQKTSKRKKSRKRKRSKSKHDKKEHRRDKDHKKSRKHRRRNASTSSSNSDR